MVENVRVDLVEAHDLVVPDGTDHQENVREDISGYICLGDYL